MRDFLSTMPLISALRHKSMRPRHWSLLMTATKKQFTPPHEDPSMKLRQLIELSLHEFIADVEEICDQVRRHGCCCCCWRRLTFLVRECPPPSPPGAPPQALKEEKMEETLAKLKETWGGIVFLSDPYKEGSDVRLLKIGEEDFETLEADQLAVQNMMASRYLATFEEEITGWQKSLAMVSEVLLSLTEIQRKWSYLEPLFIGSDEVRKELPAEATRFEGIDEGVKIVLRDAGATKLVNPACNKPGLFKELERLQGQLDQCEKALADFLDGKRRQ